MLFLTANCPQPGPSHAASILPSGLRPILLPAHTPLLVGLLTPPPIAGLLPALADSRHIRPGEDTAECHLDWADARLEIFPAPVRQTLLDTAENLLETALDY